jgi:hypothetical protein
MRPLSHHDKNSGFELLSSNQIFECTCCCVGETVEKFALGFLRQDAIWCPSRFGWPLRTRWLMGFPSHQQSRGGVYCDKGSLTNLRLIASINIDISTRKCNKSYATFSVPSRQPQASLPEPGGRMKAGRYVAQTEGKTGTWITRSLRGQYGISTEYAARSETADTTDTADSAAQQHCRTTQRKSMPKRDRKQRKKKGRNW